MQVAFFKGKGIFDDFIRVNEDDDVVHVALIVEKGARILEAHLGVGVRYRNIPEVDMSQSVILTIQTNEEQENATVAFAAAQEHKPYGGIMGLVFDRPDDSYDSWFCSKLVFESLRMGGVPPLVRTTCGRVRPSDLIHSPLFV